VPAQRISSADRLKAELEAAGASVELK